MSDLNAMVKATLGDLDAGGALADMLQELGRDREAVLLRRRWKAWQRDRANAPQEASEVHREFAASYAPDELLHEPFRLEDFRGAFVRGVDKAFAKYIKARFLPHRKPTPPAPHTCQRPRTCCCSVSGLQPSEDCPVHGGGEWPPRCEVCGRLMKYLEAA